MFTDKTSHEYNPNLRNLILRRWSSAGGWIPCFYQQFFLRGRPRM